MPPRRGWWCLARGLGGGPARRHESEAGKSGAVAARIPGEHGDPFDGGVRANKEIGQNGRLHAPSLPVLRKGLSREEQGGFREWSQGQGKGMEDLIQRFYRREGKGQLGIDDGIDDEPMNLRLAPKRRKRPVRPDGVILEYINEYVRIHEHGG